MLLMLSTLTITISGVRLIAEVLCTATTLTVILTVILISRVGFLAKVTLATITTPRARFAIATISLTIILAGGVGRTPAITTTVSVTTIVVFFAVVVITAITSAFATMKRSAAIVLRTGGLRRGFSGFVDFIYRRGYAVVHGGLHQLVPVAEGEDRGRGGRARSLGRKFAS